MPEGDALHRAARRLQVLVGERLEVETPNPRAQVKQLAERLDGRVLESAEAVGKNLLLRFEGGLTLRSHLRMTGRWRVYRRGTLRSRSPWLVLRGGEWEAAQWNGPVLSLSAAETSRIRRLGPDVLAASFDVDAAAARLLAGAAERPLGEALRDQRLVAGIGNVWMAEAAWTARVSPWLAVGEATSDELRGVLAAAAELMRASLRGDRVPRTVYRRAGSACRRCGTPIRSRGQGDDNRIAYWCPGCQRGPEPRAAGGSRP
jgi:endonuclease VIII